MSGPAQFPRLVPGQRFRMHPSCGVPYPWEVIRVTDCSATVRCLAREHVVIPSELDDQVPRAEFWRPGRPIQISPHSSVILIADEPDRSAADLIPDVE